MHAADTSLSGQHAVDVAREAADFVLVERPLDVIRDGVAGGRRTFANRLKYVLTTAGANLGNMVSMAAASLVLRLLPSSPARSGSTTFCPACPRPAWPTTPWVRNWFSRAQ
jgi:Mg2+-importing ATPase